MPLGSITERKNGNRLNEPRSDHILEGDNWVCRSHPIDWRGRKDRKGGRGQNKESFKGHHFLYVMVSSPQGVGTTALTTRPGLLCQVACSAHQT